MYLKGMGIMRREEIDRNEMKKVKDAKVKSCIPLDQHIGLSDICFR